MKFFPSFRALLFLVLVPSTLWSQVGVTVINNAGDQSNGSFGWAVTTLNNSGGGSVSFPSSAYVTFSQVLPAASQNVTLLGGAAYLTAESSAQGLLTFQQNLVLGNGFILGLENNGNLGLGLDSSVTAGNWISGQDSSALVKAGTGANLNSTPGNSETAGDGGSASLVAGSIAMNEALNLVVQGGNGGDLLDTGGTGDAGGDGGSANVNTLSMAVSATDFAVRGGIGGNVVDTGAANSMGGDGGSASVAWGAYIQNGGSDVDVTGGRGGDGTQGGDGGGASAAIGTSFLLSSGNFDVAGGDGRAGVDTGGVGGNASVTFGSMVIEQTSNFRIFGGLGAAGASGAAQGGDATWIGGPASISGAASNIQVKGGNGGNMGPSSGQYDGGNGGDASVSLAGFTAGVGAAIVVQGGVGGNGGSGTNGGDGGDGGNTTLSLGAFSIGVTTQMDFAGGFGGLGGQADPGGTAGDGGDGGDLNLTVASFTLGDGSNLNLSGGVGQTGGNTASGGVGGDGGDGGNAVFTAGAVTMGSGSSINVAGGVGGLEGNGGTDGTAGSTGSGSISIVSLDGLGIVNVSGTGSQLWVGSGTFDGILAGNATLQKATTGTLSLSGNHSYTGGTSILQGDLLVTGGRLGTGTVVNNGYLYYQNDASAVGSTIVNNQNLTFQDNSTLADSLITNNSSMWISENAAAGTANITTNDSLQFTDDSTAGAATITVNNGGSVEFYDDTQGGTARFIVNSGGDLDISNHSGIVSIGSAEGAGSFQLGNVDLLVGLNNLSTTVTGTIDGGSGRLYKVGTGAWTLSGTNGFGGGTFVTQGELVVGSAGALAGGIVWVGNTLGGAITLSTTGVPLVLQVDDYRQFDNGVLVMQLGGAGASSSDALNATGDMDLEGTLSLTEDGTLWALSVGSSVTLMTASNVYGTFSNVTQVMNGNGRYLPTYFSDRVELLSINADFAATGSTPNQQAIGADLDAIFGDVRVHDLIQVAGILSGPDFQTAVDQMSPAGLSGLYQAGFSNARSLASQVENRLTGSGSGRTSQSSIGSVLFANGSGSSRIQGFLLGDGGMLNVTGDGNGPGYKAAAYGVGGAGVDMQLAPGMRGGFLMGYNHTQVDVEDGGLLTADSAQLGLYGSFEQEGFHVWGMAEGGLNNYQTQRAAYGGTASGTPSGIQLSGALGTGYDREFGKVSAGPFGSIQYTRMEMNAFQETGSLGPLSFPAQGAESLLSRLGAKFGGNFKMGAVGLNPQVRAAWVKEFNDEGGSVQAGFGTGDSFTVAGAQVGQSGFQVGASVELTFPGSLSAVLQYQGELGRENMDSQRFGGGVQVGF